MWNSLIVPAITDTYGTAAIEKLEKLKDHAVANGTAAELGIPTGRATPTKSAPAKVYTVNSQADYTNVPPGATYTGIDANGNHYTKIKGK